MARQVGVFQFTGRLGNMVGRRLRNGYSIAIAATPTNPQTTRQMDVRNKMSQMSKIWQSISDAGKNEWDLWAAQISSRVPQTVVAGLSTSQTYTGYTLFMSCNMNIWKANENAITKPPPGLIYDPFQLVTCNSFAGDQTAGLSVDINMSWLNNVASQTNFGGIAVQYAIGSSGRQPQHLPSSICGTYKFTGAEVSPDAITVNLDIPTDGGTFSAWLQVLAVDQNGRPAGSSEWNLVVFPAAP